MDTVVFFSSRTCSDDNNYKKYLLFLNNNNMQENGGVSVSFSGNNPDKYYKDTAEEAENFMKLCRNRQTPKYPVRFTNEGKQLENEQQLTEDQNGILCSVLREVYRSKHPEQSRGAKTTPKQAEQKIIENKELLTSVGIIKPNQSNSFRKVYKYNWNENDDQKIDIYAVHEIDEKDKEEIIQIIRPKWCDMIIKYILEKNSQVKNIYLFLHDKDLDGFSNESITLIDGIENCKKRNLIDKNNNYSDANIAIVFFKHSNSMMTNIIGPFEEKTPDSQYLNTQLENIMEQLRGINGFKKLATKEQMKEQERELEKLQNKWINI